MRRQLWGGLLGHITQPRRARDVISRIFCPLKITEASDARPMAQKTHEFEYQNGTHDQNSHFGTKSPR